MVSFDSAISNTELFDVDERVLLGGRYQIMQQLAEGTFGHTYLARDWHLPDHPVCVIKQLKPQSDGNEMKTAQRLFDSEARALYTLGSHGQIPHLLAHFVEGGEFFLVQEYIRGRSLTNEVIVGTPWSEARVIALLDEILDVLSFVHQQQVIHRDIKPANLIRRYSDGKVVLIDFGAVKLASTPFSDPAPGQSALTIAIGTAGYIPKEQIGGRPRYSSDVYSTGIVAIQALTGVSPQKFSEDSWSGELDWHGLAPHVSPELAQVLDRMVRYDFRDRYVDADAALRELRQLPLHLRQSPNPPLPGLAEPSMLYPAGAPLPPTVIHDAVSPATQRHNGAQADVGATAGTEIANAAVPPQSPIHQTGDATSTASATQRQDSQPTMTLTGQAARAPGSSGLAAGPPAASHQLYGSLAPASGLSMGLSTAVNRWGYELAAALRWRLLTWRQKRLHLWYIAGVIGVMSSLAALPLVQRQTVLASAHSVDKDNLLFSAELLIQQLPADGTVDSDAFIRVVQLLNEATKLETTNRYAEALETYRNALTIDATNLNALRGRCRMLNALEQGEMALDACNDLLAVNASDAVGLWGVAKANSAMQFHDKALELFDRALDQHGDYSPLWKDRAELLWQLGNEDAAIASINQAIALQPDYDEALALRRAWLGF